MLPPRQTAWRTPIALLTDFGPGSVYVGVMHGVIAARAPRVRVIDLAHNVRPQNVAEAALDLEAAVGYFPAPTVFCCVVDPGVGTQRHALAATDGRHLFVAPDNGLLTFVERLAREDRRPWRVRQIEAARIQLPKALSATFHGRDLFAPAAAHLALRGQRAFRAIGPAIGSWTQLDLLEPSFHPARGEVVLHALAVDVFGNVITTLRRRDWEAWWGGRGTKGPLAQRLEPDPAALEIRVGRRRWRGIVRTFGEVAVGRPLAYWGSGGRLEIAVREGNAARRFSIVRGTRITLRCQAGSAPG